MPQRPTAEQFREAGVKIDDEEPVVEDLSRRNFFNHSAAVAAVLAGGATLGLSACKKKKRNPERSNPLSQPKVDVVDEKPALKKPNDIECNDATYLEACKKLAKELFESTAQIKAELAKPNAKRDELIAKKVAEDYRKANKYDEFKAYLNKNKPSKEDDIRAISKILQPLLIDGGYFYTADKLSVQKEGSNVVGTESHLTIAPIKETKLVKFEDEKGEVKIPVLLVDKPYFSTEKKSSAGRFNFNTKSAVVFKDLSKSALADRLRIMNKEGLVPQGLDFEKMLEEYTLGTIVHEACHGYLTERYPKYARGSNRIMLLGKINYKFYQEMNAPLGNQRHPIQFHELSAVGFELANNPEGFPASYMNYIGSMHKKDFISPYALVGKLIKLLTLKHADENSDLKRQMVGKMRRRQGVKAFDFVKLAKNLTPEQIKALGREMFEVGTDLLYMAETGKFKEYIIPLKK